jgi:IrrE N-terminal-like domain
MSNIEEERAEKLARELRERLGVDHLVQMDMVRVLDAMKKLGFIADYKEVPNAELDGAEGRFDPITGIICFPIGTLCGANKGDGRSNFTIAHEIGHFVDGVTEVRNRGSIKGRRTASDERFADAFAAAFLAPYERARFTRRTTPKDVRLRFNLSSQAAKIQHEKFSRRFRKANNIERPLPADVIDFLEEARARGRFVRSVSPQRIARPASRRSRSAASASPAPLGESCVVCGSPRLAIEGSTKARCLDCETTYDRFQDGDTATGL